MSATATVIPPIVEYLNPNDLIWSKTSAVIVFPCLLKHLSIILPKAFLSTKKSISNPNGSSSLFTNPKS